MPTNSLSNSHDSKAAIDEDLQLLQEAHAYLDWSYSLIQPYLGQRILELGSGIGNYSEKLLDRERILGSDMVPEYVQALQEKFRKKTTPYHCIGFQNGFYQKGKKNMYGRNKRQKIPGAPAPASLPGNPFSVNQQITKKYGQIQTEKESKFKFQFMVLKDKK